MPDVQEIIRKEKEKLKGRKKEIRNFGLKKFFYFYALIMKLCTKNGIEHDGIYTIFHDFKIYTIFI